MRSLGLDHASKALLGQFAQANRPQLYDLSLVEARAASAGLASLYADGPDLSDVTDFGIKMRDRHIIRARLFKPGPHPAGLIVYFHGGGWVVSDIDQYDVIGRQVAKVSNCAVLMAEYRKAPENQFPIPLQDAYDSAVWCQANRATWLGRDVPLVVMGDSAGGNLTAALCQMAKTDPALTPDLQVLIYPVLDGAMEGAAYADPENQLLHNTPLMQWFWDQYVPDMDKRLSPNASPLRAESFAGLPPTLFIAAEFDILREDGERYVEQLRGAGIEVTYRQFEGQMHNFFAMAGLLPAQQLAVAYLGEQIRRKIDQF